MAKNSKHDPLKSPIIQFGIVFFMVAVIILVAFVVKYYTP